MPSYDVAHIREQGQDMIIVPLDDDFDRQTPSQQNAFIDHFQLRAHSAGLAGTVVAVWESASGRMKFIAPTQWHPFFRSIGLRRILASLNRTISW